MPPKVAVPLISGRKATATPEPRPSEAMALDLMTQELAIHDPVGEGPSATGHTTEIFGAEPPDTSEDEDAEPRSKKQKGDAEDEDGIVPEIDADSSDDEDDDGKKVGTVEPQQVKILQDGEIVLKTEQLPMHLKHREHEAWLHPDESKGVHGNYRGQSTPLASETTMENGYRATKTVPCALTIRSSTEKMMSFGDAIPKPKNENKMDTTEYTATSTGRVL